MRLKRDVQERRVYWVRIYCRTLSLKAAFEATSEKFHVSIPVLRVDWSRRDRWPKEIFENVTDPVLIYIYLLGIHRTLQQTELLLSKTTNDNCRVGALKLKADSLFKLINLQKSIMVEGILERLENMERTLDEILESKKESREKR